MIELHSSRFEVVLQIFLYGYTDINVCMQEVFCGFMINDEIILQC